MHGHLKRRSLTRRGGEGFRYVKFDTFHPAVEKGLPVTRVISRVTLQQVLAKACRKIGGDSIICNDCHVVDYEETVQPPTACKCALMPCIASGHTRAHMHLKHMWCACV